MKVVILHDWLTGFRGGERVLEALCEMYPQAPIYTLIHVKGSTSPTIESREIKTSFLNKIPSIHKHYRKFLPIMPLAARLLKITHDCDLVISSSHCVIKGVKKPKNSKHICYIHSPMRYIYDQFDNYFGTSPLPIKIAAYVCRPFLRWWDNASNSNVDLFVANSNFVKQRVTKYYSRESIVINPFVDLDDFKAVQKIPPKKEKFYLMVTAFAPNKKVDLAIKIFNKNKLPLKIIGAGSQSEEDKLRSSANSNINFLGKLSREEVITHYAKAKAFIFPGVEDFGITPLEANAAGTGLIAYAKGGVLETQNEQTALFFNNDIEFQRSIDNFELPNITTLHQNADRFSKQVFVKKIESLIQDRFIN